MNINEHLNEFFREDFLMGYNDNDNEDYKSYNTFKPDEMDNMPIIVDKPVKNTSPKKSAALAGAGGLALLLLKFKWVLLFLLGKLKFLLVLLKLGKFAATFGSMLLMIVVEVQRYGFLVGVGFVMLILIHEMGHFLTAKKCGLNVSAPVFIPFVGAFISMKEMPKNVEVEVKVAFGGPLLGCLGAFLCLGIYALTGSKSMLFLTYVGLIINLFNLIPITPLDGGRIISGLSPKIWFVGMALMGLAAIFTRSPMMILILILGVVQIISYWKNPDKSYFNIDANKRKLIGVLYFGLVIFLGASIFEIYQIYDFKR